MTISLFITHNLFVFLDPWQSNFFLFDRSHVFDKIIKLCLFSPIRLTKYNASFFVKQFGLHFPSNTYQSLVLEIFFVHRFFQFLRKLYRVYPSVPINFKYPAISSFFFKNINKEFFHPVLVLTYLLQTQFLNTLA